VKILKYLPKEPMGERRNHKVNFKQYSEMNKNENETKNLQNTLKYHLQSK
jgi:hypothetical protein